MIKEFIPYQQALALKELGFDETCFAYYKDMKGEKVLLYDSMNFDGECNTPLYQQAFRWFREKYGLDSWVEETNHGIDNVNKRYLFQVLTPTSHLNRIKFYDTHEEAELACLIKLIEIVKTK